MKKIILLLNLIISLAFTSYSQLINNDAAVISIDLSTTLCAGMEDVYATIGNDGENQIDSVEIHWEVNGISMSMLKYKQLLDTANGSSSDTAQVFLGSGNFNSGINSIKVWVSSPNGMQDPVSSNDTLSFEIKTGLSGIYTIDASSAASSSNYLTFTDAVDDLNKYGLCGAVTINVASGTYTESVILNEVSGASATNTITFNGASNSTTKLTSNSTNAATFVLNASDYITISNMEIESTSKTNAAIKLETGSEHNTISNNIIKVPVANISSSTSSTALLFDAAVSYNTVKSNTVLYGNYGIRLIGTSAEPDVYNSFLDNYIDSVYAYSFHADFQDSLLMIGNKILSVGSAASTFVFAAYLSNTVNATFEKNTIHSKTYGALFQNFSIPTASVREKKYEINNNMIISDGYYGVWMQGIDSVDFYHNSVLGGASTPALRIQNSSTGIADYDVRNNILHGSQGPAIETDVLDSIFTELDYNIYYTTGTNLFKINSVNHVNLAAYQTASPNLNDSSIEGNPQFASSSDLHMHQPIANNVGDNSVGVKDDIDGDGRPIAGDTVVDIGADEYRISTIDVKVVALLAPIEVVNKCYSTNEDVIVGLSNLGMDSLNFTVDTAEITVEVSGTISQNFTYTLDNNTLNNGNSLSPLAADSIQVLMGTVDMSLPGKYYFKVSIDLKSDIDSLNNLYVDSVSVSSPVGGKVSGADTICFGDSTILSVEAFIGGKLQWQYLDGRSWYDIAGETDETIKVSPGNSTSYRVVTCGLYFLPSDSFTLDVVSPSLPVAFHDTVKVICGDTADITLQAVSNDPNANLEWYDQPIGGSKLISSSNIYISEKGDSLIYSVTPFSPYLPSLDTFYVEEVIGTSGKVDTLTVVNFTGGSSCNGGNMFDVIGKNDFSIDGFLINSYTSGWQTVEVYFKKGTYSTSVSSSNDWTHLESVDVFGNGTGVPSHLKLTDSIAVKLGDTIGIYIDYDANYTNVTMGTSYSNDDMEVVLGYGFCTSFQFGNAGRGFNGRILYSSGCTSGRVAVVGRAECKVTDLEISSLTSPVSLIDSCYSSSEGVELKLLNLGSEELDFSVDTTWLNIDVSGAATQSYSMVLNDNLLNGGMPLSAGDSILINMGNLDMSSHGSYDFTAYSTVVLDENFANDTIRVSIINSPSGGSLNIVKNVCDSGKVDLETTGAAGSLQWQRLLGSSFADEINADSAFYTVYVDSTVSFRVLACGTEISDTLVVKPNATPLMPTTFNDTAIVLCGDSGTAVLTATSVNSSDGFAWYDSLNAGKLLSSADTFYFGHATVAWSPSVYLDTFFVSAVDSLTGCESERSMVTGIVWCTIGEEEMPSALSGISIQPNPSKGVFQLIGENVEEVLDLTIYNANGKAVYHMNAKVSNNFNEQIDLSGLSKGMYFIKFQGDKSMEMRKVVIH